MVPSLYTKLGVGERLRVYKACAPIINENLKHSDPAVLSRALEFCTEVNDDHFLTSMSGHRPAETLMDLFPNLTEAVLKGLRTLDDDWVLAASLAVLSSTTSTTVGFNYPMFHTIEVFECFVPMLRAKQTDPSIVQKVLDCLSMIGRWRTNHSVELLEQSGCFSFILTLTQGTFPADVINAALATINQLVGVSYIAQIEHFIVNGLLDAVNPYIYVGHPFASPALEILDTLSWNIELEDAAIIGAYVGEHHPELKERIMEFAEGGDPVLARFASTVLETWW